MSTTFTIGPPEDVVEKPLGLLLVDAQQWMTQHVMRLVHDKGHDLSQAEFAFLANLDCGETHASSVARRMGISRQAVYRTTRGLQERGLLELLNDPERGNQKIVSMTDAGKDFISDARACLAEAEAELARRIGKDQVAALAEALSKPWGKP